MSKGMKLERGFKQVQKRITSKKGRERGIRSCDTCKSFYSDEGSKKEHCHNNGVTSYDMVNDGTKEYCTYWQPVWAKDRDNF